MPRFRPALRFSLSTLLVLVAIAAVAATGIGSLRNRALERCELSFRQDLRLHHAGAEPLPWYREFFGELPIGQVWTHPDFSDGELQVLARLFPEATVKRWPVNPEREPPIEFQGLRRGTPIVTNR